MGRKAEALDNPAVRRRNLVVHQLNLVVERWTGKVKCFLEEPVAPDIVESGGPPSFMVISTVGKFKS